MNGGRRRDSIYISLYKHSTNKYVKRLLKLNLKFYVGLINKKFLTCQLLTEIFCQVLTEFEIFCQDLTEFEIFCQGLTDIFCQGLTEFFGLFM